MLKTTIKYLILIIFVISSFSLFTNTDVLSNTDVIVPESQEETPESQEEVPIKNKNAEDIKIFNSDIDPYLELLVKDEMVKDKGVVSNYFSLINWYENENDWGFISMYVLDNPEGLLSTDKGESTLPTEEVVTFFYIIGKNGKYDITDKKDKLKLKKILADIPEEKLSKKQKEAFFWDELYKDKEKEEVLSINEVNSSFLAVEDTNLKWAWTGVWKESGGWTEGGYIEDTRAGNGWHRYSTSTTNPFSYWAFDLVPYSNTNDNILAMSSGVVTDKVCKSGSGGDHAYLTIDHGNGVKVNYTHLRDDSVTLNPGDTVTQGQKLGVVTSKVNAVCDDNDICSFLQDVTHPCGVMSTKKHFHVGLSPLSFASSSKETLDVDNNTLNLRSDYGGATFNSYNSLGDPCPNQFQASYFNTTDLSGTLYGPRCEGYGVATVGLEPRYYIYRDWLGTGDNWLSSSVFSDRDTFSVRYEGYFDFGSEDAMWFFKFDNTDDGAKLYIDNELIIDGWDFSLTSSGMSEVLSGTHKITVKYKEDYGGQNLNFWWWKMPNKTMYAKYDNGYDFNSRYYAVTGNLGTITSSNSGSYGMDWGTGSPVNNHDYFNMHAFGYYYFDKSGNYDFTIAGDDVVQVYVDRSQNHKVTLGSSTQTYNISEGWHRIDLKFQEGWGDAWWNLNWSYNNNSPILLKKASQHCINAYQPYNGKAANMWACDGTIDQDWYYTNEQFVRAGTSLCLTHDSSTNSISATLKTCDSNNANQKWEFLDDLWLIRKKNTNLCLNAANPYNGSVLNVDYCNTNDEDQRIVRRDS